MRGDSLAAPAHRNHMVLHIGSEHSEAARDHKSATLCPE